MPWGITADVRDYHVTELMVWEASVAVRYGYLRRLCHWLHFDINHV